MSASLPNRLKQILLTICKEPSLISMALVFCFTFLMTGYSNFSSDRAEAQSHNNGMIFFFYENGGNCESCRWIIARGVIDKDSVERFKNFLDEGNVYYGMTIHLNSPGGDLFSAMKLGRLIRSRGLKTTIGDQCVFPTNSSASIRDEVNANKCGNTRISCLSACSYMFMGGVSRTLSDSDDFDSWALYDKAAALKDKNLRPLTDNSSLGFHRIYVEMVGDQPLNVRSGSGSFGIAGDAAQIATSDVARYLQEMGVSNEILQIASRVSYDSIYYPEKEDLRKFRVIHYEVYNQLRLEPTSVGVAALAVLSPGTAGARYFGFTCNSDGHPIFIWARPFSKESDTATSFANRATMTQLPPFLDNTFWNGKKINGNSTGSNFFGRNSPAIGIIDLLDDEPVTRGFGEGDVTINSDKAYTINTLNMETFVAPLTSSDIQTIMKFKRGIGFSFGAPHSADLWNEIAYDFRDLDKVLIRTALSACHRFEVS